MAWDTASPVKRASLPVTARKARNTRPTAAKMFIAVPCGIADPSTRAHLPQRGENTSTESNLPQRGEVGEARAFGARAGWGANVEANPPTRPAFAYAPACRPPRVGGGQR